MTDKESKIVEKIAVVQAKQAQNRVEQDCNKVNGDLLAEELDELKAELEAAKKPELRHGDYGLPRNAVRYVLRDNKTNKLKQGGCSTYNCGDEWLKPDDVMGNFIDDLKAIAEPLTKFEMEDCDEECIEVSQSSRVKGGIRIEVDREPVDLTIEQAEDFNTNFRRMIHTLRSKK